MSIQNYLLWAGENSKQNYYKKQQQQKKDTE